MKKIVIMPGGFHPFHAGHAALYQSAVKAFPDAEVYVAATNDTKTRPFPFSIKEKLAKLAGVAPGHFIQVKSPFKSEEITSHYNPNEDVLIFVRSAKDKTEQPKPGGTKKDGTPAYFQPWTGKDLQPFSKHAYMAYLPTVEFGPGITSATEIRNAWPNLNDKRKTAMVMSLYPATQKNPKLAANVVKMLDMGMGGGENIDEGISLHDVAWIGNLVPSFMQRIASAGTREAKQTALLGKILGKWVGTGELTPGEESFAKQQLIDIAKMIAGMAVASAVTASAPAHAAASAVASGVTHIAQHGAVDLGLEALAVMLSKNFKFDFLKKIMHSLETDSGKAFSHIEKKQAQAPQDAVDKQVNQQFQKAKMGFGGMSESSADNPWGDQGNFAGDKPVNIGGTTVKQLQVGDIVTYFGQKARIDAMSKTGNTSRITIANKMGGFTKDVLTSDLKRAGLTTENSGGGGAGFGPGYPGTYEEENNPFKSKGKQRSVNLTTEANPNQQQALYKPDGTTYRGEKMPTLDNPDDIYSRSQAYNIDDMEDEPADEPNMDNSIKELIKSKLDMLEPRERKILQLRFWHDMTLRDIAEKVGVNPARIAQIEAKAMRKIKQSTLTNNPELLRMYVPESADYLEEK